MLVALTLLGATAGCPRRAAEPTPAERTAAERVTIVGSTALLPLVKQAAADFRAENPGVTINVTGGGSSSGLSRVASGAADIGTSDVFAPDDLAKEKKLVDHQVAIAPFVIVVHPSVGLDSLTQEQLIRVFTGRIANWKPFGGADQRISIVGRSDSSGSRAIIKEKVLSGHEFSRNATVQDSNGAARAAVASTPGAIGYIDAAYLDSSVKPVAFNGVPYSPENVRAGKYPLYAVEHMYTRGKPTGATKRFLEYVLSDKVQQKLLGKLGFIPAAEIRTLAADAGYVMQTLEEPNARGPDYGPLKARIQQYIARKEATYGIYFKDLVSGQTFGINERDRFEAASTIKVPIALYLNQLAAEGKIDWQEKVAYNSATDYEEGAGILQFSARDGDKYSLRVLSNLLITVSDNIAWNMLERYLGRENIAAYMRSIGGETVYPEGQNITTARDMAVYMQAVLNFSSQHKDLGQRLLDDMANSIYHVGLPGRLPEHLVVPHKEGDVWGVADDVGVVFGPRPYLLVVLSTNVPDVDQGFAAIAEISKIAYDYQQALAQAER